ncbi:MAG: N-formylglutamate amidohydrolase [Halocynthiibacter sp.]|jgi:N-formylglutamate amidohydrolase
MPRVRTTSVVFASPHSGRDYTADFLDQSVLDMGRLRSSEDAFVDLLFSQAPQNGAPLLAARAPRAWIDLNRGADEFDPALIRDVPNRAHNPRISSGLGVVPRVVSAGRAIYNGKIPLEAAQARLKTIWHPYHNRLQSLLDQSHALFGEAILIDCHSMPHEAVEGAGRVGPGSAPQIVLGDRFGAAAHTSTVDQIEAAFQAAGLRVARNAPFAGAFIAQHYGRPSRNQHVIQIEIDRSLYMDEATITPHEDFDEFREMMAGITAKIAAIGREELPLAAE